MGSTSLSNSRCWEISTPSGEVVEGMAGLDDKIDGGRVDLSHVVLFQHIGLLG